MKKVLLQGISIFILLTLIFLDTALALDVKEIIGNFRKKYESVKNFNANFEQTTIIAGQKRIAKGKLNFQKPNLLRQEYTDPSNPKTMTQLIVADGKIIWSYTPLINQIIKQGPIEDGSRMELLPGFGQSLENIDKNYSLSLVVDELAEKSGVHVVEFTPKSHIIGSSTVFDVMRIWVRDKDSMPVQFMYKDQKNETTFVLSFKDVKINENLDESVFKFEPPKGVQIITAPVR